MPTNRITAQGSQIRADDIINLARTICEVVDGNPVDLIQGALLTAYAQVNGLVEHAHHVNPDTKLRRVQVFVQMAGTRLAEATLKIQSMTEEEIAVMVSHGGGLHN